MSVGGRSDGCRPDLGVEMTGWLVELLLNPLNDVAIPVDDPAAEPRRPRPSAPVTPEAKRVLW